jgi:hypothetical protein
LLIWKAGAKRSDSWPVKTRLGSESLEGAFTAGKESVTLPAGTYKTVTSAGLFRANGQTITVKY